MKSSRFFDSFWARNLLGLAVLMAAHYLTDWYAIDQRPGISKITPYLYLLLLYGWLVVHNRLLFERLFLRGKKAAYFGWLLLGMTLGSFNMNFILRTEFDISRSLPYLVNFWVYTVTGLGVFVTYRYLRAQQSAPPSPPSIAVPDEPGSFSCTVDGVRQLIPYADIHYVESLENYLRIVTRPKTYITRLTLKEAEDRLPKPPFVRISRSAIVNASHVDSREPDAVRIGAKELRIGKVYKRYVAEQWSNK